MLNSPLFIEEVEGPVCPQGLNTPGGLCAISSNNTSLIVSILSAGTFFGALMAGDIADATLNYTLVVRKARQAEIPGWLLRKMLANNAVSAGIGFVPLVGDVMLATYKANSRNAALLEEFLRIR